MVVESDCRKIHIHVHLCHFMIIFTALKRILKAYYLTIVPNSIFSAVISGENFITSLYCPNTIYLLSPGHHDAERNTLTNQQQSEDLLLPQSHLLPPYSFLPTLVFF